MKLNAFLERIPAINTLSQNADHLDWKRYDSQNNLCEFIAGFINYYPGWLKFLYRVRAVFVRFLGMKQEGIPQLGTIQPEDIPMQADEWLSFFQVKEAEPEHYWIAHASDTHLTAYLIIARDAATGQFYVVTIVNYHHWTGPVYFNVIRPFHHVVVHQMAQNGVRFRAQTAGA